MKKVYPFQVICICLLLLTTGRALGQQSNLAANTNTPLISGTFNHLAVASSSGLLSTFSNKGYLIDTSLSNHADWSFLVGGSAWIGVKDSSAVGAEVYPAGSIAGFAIDNSNINILGNVTIATYLGDTLQESQTGTGILELGIVSGKAEIGFTTTKNFDGIRISFSSLGIAGTAKVYYAFVHKFVAGPSLSCNLDNSMISPTFPVSIDMTKTGVSGVSVGSVDSPDNVIDNDSNNYATINVTAGLLSSYAALAVKENITDYPAGTFVGFDLSSSALLNLSLLSGVEIETYLNDTLKESKPASSLLVDLGLAPGSGQSVIGFRTSTKVDEVRLIINSEALNVNLGTTKVYGVIFRKFCEADSALSCNESTQLRLPEYPIYVDKAHSGLLNVGLGNSIDSLNNVLDSAQSTAAIINKPTVSGEDSVTLSVKKALSPFPARTFAGIDLETVGVIGTDALNAVSVSLYRNDTLVQTANGGSLIALGIPLVNGSGRWIVGLLADTSYNEIRLTTNFGLASLSLLSAVKVYGFEVKKFCNGPDLACNIPTTMGAPSYPLYVDGQHTGISAGINLGTINNAEAAIDGDTGTYAVINQTVGLLSTATFTIGNVLKTYPAKTFAGMDISDTSALGLAVLNYITINLLKDGEIVQSAAPSDLLVNVNPALLTGNDRRTIGIVSDTSFDAIELVSSQPVNVNIGKIMVHGAILDKLCAAPLLCNKSELLQYGSQPVVINNSRTGVLGVANAGSIVKNPQNVLDSSNTRYAQLTTVAGVLSDASLSVVNPLQTYPAGTFAGYIVKNSIGALNVGLLNSISIKTYLNGVLQESKSGSQLVNLTLLVTVLGPGSYVKNLGFITTKPFNEIQISLGEITSVLASVNVYGAFVDTRTSSSGILQCMSTHNDFAVTYLHVTVDGNISTNDITPAGSTYGVPISDSNNPSVATPVMSSDGTYTFSPDSIGKYVYYVPVHIAGLDSSYNSYTETLTITVLNIDSTPNKPVANNDIAATLGDTTSPHPITIHVLKNDGVGNVGDTLETPTVYNSGTRAPSHGTVSVDSSGNVIYTPAPNFFGTDTFVYNVCATPSNLCDTAVVEVYVLQPQGENVTTAADDYNHTPINTLLSVNADSGVLSNDMDPQGHTQTVTAKADTISGKGILNLASDGSYTFTPDSNFVGEVEFPYEVTDNDTPAATSYATLHILVGPPDSLQTDLSLMLQLMPSSVIGNGSSSLLLNIFELYGKATNGEISVYILKSSHYTLSFSDTVTNFSNTSVNNADWTVDSSSAIYYKLTTSHIINAFGLSKIGLEVSVEPGAQNGSTVITGFIGTGSGGDVYSNDNSDDESLQYFQ